VIDIEQLDFGVAKITIKNPERRNALNGEMLEALIDTWDRLSSDDAVRVAVITGDGAAFCTGADLSQSLHTRSDIDSLVDRALLKTSYFRKPLVAAINGHCVAGGLELALAADIRITDRNAKLGFPEVKWGIIPSGGGAMKLLEQMPYAHAMDLLITGRLISGEDAAVIGLVTSACDAQEVLPVAMERAELIARNSPLAVQLTKRAALEHRSAVYADREATERELVAMMRQSGHQDEGIAAFLEKREPSYSAQGCRPNNA